jgi:hypothetical protein
MFADTEDQELFEAARNVVSERLLGMPREHRADGGAFRDVPRGPGAVR